VPQVPVLRLFLTRGRGAIAHVTCEDIVLRHKGRRDVPPMFAMKRIEFNVDLGRVFEPEKRVALVKIDRMEIVVPPKGERPKIAKHNEAGQSNNGLASQFLIERIEIADSRFIILPRVKDRKPLEFDLHNVVLESVQKTKSLTYRARLTNPKPPGLIEAKGTFGPWDSDTPGDTPLSGEYTYSNADLSVFSSIAGTLNSTGTFEGTLNAVNARGSADIPDFRLKSAGNPVHLRTNFETLVDGTNGNTVLKPIRARLNTTQFVTSGAIIKHDGNNRRSIDLDVNMPNGELLDLLRLAMKAKPIMSGRVQMSARIQIPPLQGKVGDKLILDGKFIVQRGQFLRNDIQDKIDTLSRRGQGQPGNEAISDVFSDMRGEFHLGNRSIEFKTLSFDVPGSRVSLAGIYDVSDDQLDFDGSLSLDAKVSQTMTGWKRWVLKPIDPIFARNGAGTLLKIKVTGSSKQPQFAGRF
jgi:hypothetical protein